jgi:hypothetical protein
MPEPPPKWGTDEITKFFDTARGNAYATFANLNAEYGRIAQIDGALRKLGGNLNHSEDWFAGFFVLTAHSSWLAAVNLSMSAQVTETYVMLRASLENGLYGFRIAKNPNLRETWLRRNDSPKHKSQMLEEFKFRNLIDTLSREDANEARAAETLYDQCIDQGAHPNELALMQNLTMQEGAQSINFEFKYMNPDPLVLGLALKSTARVGMCVLGIFSRVYKTRFDLLGLSVLLPRLRQGL